GRHRPLTPDLRELREAPRQGAGAHRRLRLRGRRVPELRGAHHAPAARRAHPARALGSPCRSLSAAAHLALNFWQHRRDVKTLDAWFSNGIAPSFVFATLIVALLVTALSPLVIKRRMRSALLLCFGYGIVVSIAALLGKGSNVRQQLEAAAYLFAALAAA